MPIETLQKLLGHKKIETTLVYSRVYDSTLAAGYHKAMRLIEGTPEQPVQGSDLLALVDVLEAGTLDEAQQEAAQALRVAILSLGMETVPGDKNSDTGASVV